MKLRGTLVPAAFTLLSAQASAWVVLNDGTALRSGQISSTLRWQASGDLYEGGCNKAFQIKNCYTLRVGGPGTNLVSTTPAPSSRSRTFETAPDDDVDLAAAAEDDDVELYARAFPQHDFAAVGAENLLEKRQVVLNCTGGGGNGTEPPKPPSPRQRIEFLSWPGALAGETWQYKWRTRQSTTSSSSKFYHIWQILCVSDRHPDFMPHDGINVALCLQTTRCLRRSSRHARLTQLLNNNIVIRDNVRKCPSSGCASIPAKSWFGKTIEHSVTIKFGVEGTLEYVATDALLPGSAPLIAYSASGDMGHKTSLKSGIYRASHDGLQPSEMFLGQWTANRVQISLG
ncbi:hypothetical protein ACM66B_005905 [Microbotryomycetes sp. NB124-2]